MTKLLNITVIDKILEFYKIKEQVLKKILNGEAIGTNLQPDK